MLKYKLKENAIPLNSSKPMEDYLRSLGIDKPDRFMIKPQPEDELDPFLLDNMEKCVVKLQKVFSTSR